MGDPIELHPDGDPALAEQAHKVLLAVVLRLGSLNNKGKFAPAVRKPPTDRSRHLARERARRFKARRAVSVIADPMGGVLSVVSESVIES